ncbi:MAG: gliding motility-associated C-terminal domain-containing protein [Saprospiraceae bacterium]|nr:gliding motility-associated C-terminal domain-containing protein [Saprospiraceae bacterium]
MKQRTTLAMLIMLLRFATAEAQFFLNGSAVQFNDTCWTLTPAQNNKVGSIWNGTKVDLGNSFQVIMDMYFGCKDGDGADGILFGLQPVSTSIGQAGEGIGFQGVTPSLGIEFDTWQNFNLSDPGSDHVAICKNGNLNHGGATNLAGPIQANASNANIEDCDWHKLRVDWDAPTHTLDVWFDCDKRLTYTADIVNEIFGGDPNVFWGFTSATGGANNEQKVCFSYVTFLDKFEDVVICPGGQYQITLSGGVEYHWSPPDGLSNPDIANPIAAPDETTEYQVEVLDACGNTFFDTINVIVDGDTVFFDLGVDTSFCEGQSLLLDATSFGTNSVDYQWSSGQTSATVLASQTGLYAVTVTIDDYCKADDRKAITVIPLPKATLGTDTSLCLGQSLVLDATTTGNPSYLWSDGLAEPSRTVISPGTYSVVASNICGAREANITVAYEDCRQVYFPSAFSPNGDGINDVFMPFDGGDVGIVRSLQVFDRWGELVFEFYNFQPNDLSAPGGWDGFFKGKNASQGVYAWLAQVEFRDGFQQLLAGEVTLLR